eukprot:201979_1
MSPVVAQQALAAFEVIDSPEGVRRIQNLSNVTERLRRGLVSMGCRVVGDRGAPVVCIRLCHPEKISGFGRAAIDAGVASVVVGHPATPVLLSRARFCVSSAHTAQDIDDALLSLEKVARDVGVRYALDDAPLTEDVPPLPRRRMTAPSSPP